MQEKAALLYHMSEKSLEYDLLKVNVFYSSLMEKTVTDKKDYDLRVGIEQDGSSCKYITRMAVSSPLLGEVFLFGSESLSVLSSSWFTSETYHFYSISYLFEMVHI